MKDKHMDPSLLTARERLASLGRRGPFAGRSPPPAFLLCRSGRLAEWALRRHRHQRVAGHHAALAVLRTELGEVGLASGFGVGAPATAVLQEDLAALGVRAFFAIGTAGGLARDIGSGDLVLCDGAVRDEGTSHHYLPAGVKVGPDPSLLERTAAALTARKLAFHIGASWTTDAPYRETRREVEHYSGQGVLTVDMEAAALFAVGDALGLAVAAGLVVADHYDGDRWRLDVDANRVQSSLEVLFEAGLEALL